MDEEIVIRDAEGRPVHFAVSAIPVRDAGTVTAVVSLFRDVTKAREAEQLKDDFLSLISHELRTPLTTIQGAAPCSSRRGTPCRRKRAMRCGRT